MSKDLSFDSDLPVNKDPNLLRQMLKKVSGKNHKLKEELAVLQETIQNHTSALLLKEEIISKSNQRTNELESIIKEKDKEIENKNKEILNLQNEKDEEINTLKAQINQNLSSMSDLSRDFELDARIKAFEQEKLKFELEKKAHQLEMQKMREKENEQKEQNETPSDKEQMLNDQFELLANEQHKIDLQKKVLEEMKQTHYEEISKLETIKTDLEIEKQSVQVKLDEIKKNTAKNEKILSDIQTERAEIEKKKAEITTETEKLTAFRDSMSEKIKEFEEREKNLINAETEKQRACEQYQQCLEREKAANESRIKYESQQAEIDRLQATLLAKLKLCDATNNEAQRKMDQLLIREEQLDAKVARVRENAEKARRDAEQTINALRQQVEDVSRKARNETEKANELQTKNEQFELEINSLKTENVELKANLSRLNSVIESADEMDRMRSEIASYKEKEKEFETGQWELDMIRKEVKIQEAKYETLEKKLQAEIARYDESTRGHIDGVHASYLKKTLLQFFLIEDNKKREDMITMLLTLVNCDDSQIQRALKCWKESQQIINSGIWSFK